MIDELHPLLSQPRFQPLENWDWNYRELSGIKIRYGLPRSRKTYKAVAVILGGLGDFGEQYFEFSQDLDKQNIKPVIIDLPGQGGSDRYLKNSHKRHSAGFDALLKDLGILIDEIAHSTAIDIENNHLRLPVILIAHSMGAHLALRYLAEYNKTSRGQTIISAAALSAPMIKIKAIEKIPSLIGFGILKLLALAPTSYVPGGCNWTETYRDRAALKGIFTQDQDRAALQKAFFTHPEYRHLTIGSPTNKWLNDAVKSCKKLEKRTYLEQIDTPVLIGLAGDDQLVSNLAIREAAAHIKDCELLEIEGSQHEILMEQDQYRSVFLDRFFTFIENNVFNKTNNGKYYIQ
ncbi:MAG: alpha/beta fold hydrolase [Alphaproteobacteria bacterium]|nr:alpha/beta fold hydrolase [Alphaproteobacteria bacterium]MCB1551206.1 alpha/beta fold hydrolase [Alphaproteobacteria bacterium]MCB9985222.1 alpha/beta fold hydrolase [Micavibrio sp.]HPQ51040.1 alpha/beta fold hydrolase [Alphaproteobacteria bacterium]HRK98109.1 alpha/beta fold hydrolase [Alphaproteobacteria bacterium]